MAPRKVATRRTNTAGAFGGLLLNAERMRQNANMTAAIRRVSKTCGPGKMVNPATGRCISRTGKAARAARGCPAGKIMNSATARCVKSSGRIGQALLWKRPLAGYKSLRPNVAKGLEDALADAESSGKNVVVEFSNPKSMLVLKVTLWLSPTGVTGTALVLGRSKQGIGIRAPLPRQECKNRSGPGWARDCAKKMFPVFKKGYLKKAGLAASSPVNMTRVTMMSGSRRGKSVASLEGAAVRRWQAAARKQAAKRKITGLKALSGLPPNMARKIMRDAGIK